MRTAAINLAKNLAINLAKNLAKKLFIRLTEKYLNKTLFTMFTFVHVLVLFFTAGATHSTTKMTLAKTTISIHMLTDVFALIGFETVRSHNKTLFKDGLGWLRSLDL